MIKNFTIAINKTSKLTQLFYLVIGEEQLQKNYQTTQKLVKLILLESFILTIKKVLKLSLGKILKSQ